MRRSCLVGADSAQRGQHTTRDDDQQQDGGQSDGPGTAATAFVFVLLLFVDAGGLGVGGHGAALAGVPALGGADGFLAGGAGGDLLVGIGGALRIGVAEDFGAQCILRVGERMVLDEKGIEKGIRAGVRGDQVAASLGGDAQIENLNVASGVGGKRAGVGLQQGAAVGRGDDD